MKPCRHLTRFCLVVLASTVVSCSSPEKAWQSAQRRNTKQGYEDFLKEYPSGPFASDASQMIRDLTPVRGRIVLAFRPFISRGYVQTVEQNDPVPLSLPEIESPAESRFLLYLECDQQQSRLLITKQTRFEGIKGDALTILFYSGHQYEVTGKHKTRTQFEYVDDSSRSEDGSFVMLKNEAGPGARRLQTQVAYVEAQLIRYLGPAKAGPQKIVMLPCTKADPAHISDHDIGDYYNAHKADFKLAEPRIRLAQILVRPRNPYVRNPKNDGAQEEQEARNKVEMIMARAKQGEDFGTLARTYSEDPNTALHGGDMGYIPESALARASAEIRKAVMTLQPGQVSYVKTPEGYSILTVVSKEPAGQRELSEPLVQRNIRETLLNGCRYY